MSLRINVKKTIHLCVLLICVFLSIFMIAFGLGVSNIENKIYGYIMTAAGVIIAILFLITTVLFMISSKGSRKKNVKKEEIEILKDCICSCIDIYSSVLYNTKEKGVLTAEAYYKEKANPNNKDIEDCLSLFNEKEIEDIQETLMLHYSEDREYLGNLLYDIITEKALYDYIITRK